MTYFKFLDNKFRNYGLDQQISDEFNPAVAGFQQACHAWVGGIRSFFKYVRLVTLPFEYLLAKAFLLPRDIDYESRYAELKAASEKQLAAFPQQLQQATQAQAVPPASQAPAGDPSGTQH
jgi:hypothetical protein